MPKLLPGRRSRWLALVAALAAGGCSGGGTFVPRDLAGLGGGGDGAGSGGDAGRDLATGGGGDGGAADLAASGGDQAMGQSGTPAHIAIFRGNGYVAVEQWPGGDPLRALVTDGSGMPVANSSVGWSAISGAIQLPGNMDQTSTTDGNGVAEMTIRGDGFANSQPWSNGIIRASIAAGSVDFQTITIHTTNLGALSPGTYRTVPQGLDIGTGKVKTVLASAVQFQIVIQSGDFNNMPIPGVGVWVDDPNDPYAQPPAGCFTLSDAQGLASCDLQLGAAAGNYSLRLVIGGYSHFDGLTVEITN